MRGVGILTAPISRLCHVAPAATLSFSLFLSLTAMGFVDNGISVRRMFQKEEMDELRPQFHALI